MKLPTCIAGIGLSFLLSASAQNPGFMVAGIGSQKCDYYKRDVRGKESMEQVAMSWMLGYLSAWNAVAHATERKTIRIPDGYSLLKFTDSYCRDKPEGFIKDAMDFTFLYFSSDK